MYNVLCIVYIRISVFSAPCGVSLVFSGTSKLQPRVQCLFVFRFLVFPAGRKHELERARYKNSENVRPPNKLNVELKAMRHVHALSFLLRYGVVERNDQALASPDHLDGFSLVRLVYSRTKVFFAFLCLRGAKEVDG